MSLLNYIQTILIEDEKKTTQKKDENRQFNITMISCVRAELSKCKGPTENQNGNEGENEIETE